MSTRSTRKRTREEEEGETTDAEINVNNDETTTTAWEQVISDLGDGGRYTQRRENGRVDPRFAKERYFLTINYQKRLKSIKAPAIAVFRAHF